MWRALTFVALVGCSTSTLPASAACSASSDCDKGLMCLDFAQINGSACMNVGKQCTIACTDDASCASLGSAFRCFATCTADKVCGKVGP